MHGVQVGDVVQIIQIGSNGFDPSESPGVEFWRESVLFLAKTCRYAPKDVESACLIAEVQFLKLTEISPKNVTRCQISRKLIGLATRDLRME